MSVTKEIFLEHFPNLNTESVQSTQSMLIKVHILIQNTNIKKESPTLGYQQNKINWISQEL